MLSRISRLPLRRCLHTGAPAANSASSFGRTAKIIVGVSTFSATAYFTWRLRESRHIALDSPSSNNCSSYRKTVTSVMWLILYIIASLLSTSKPSIHSNPPSSSFNSPPNGEIPHSSTDSDSDTITGDAEKEDNVDEEGVDGEGSSGEGAPASGGAFNPETGEINWDCPCLGGMAHGPCGPEFREAFSCFVYSEAEPKGINCVEKFQSMQNCFRAHPEIYADGETIFFFVLIICVLIGGFTEISDDDEEQPPQPESSNTDKVDDDATTTPNSPSKPLLEGEVSSQNEE